MANEVNSYLQPLATKTASYTGTAISLPGSGGPRRGYVFKMSVNNVAATSTLAAGIQLSRDGGTTWITYGTFVNHKNVTTDTITTADEYYAHLHDDDIYAVAGSVYPHQIRLNVVIGGTTPSFDITVAQTLSIAG